MSLADHCPLSNRIFDPATVDEFYYAPEPMKRKLMDYHANTNYSVVDLDLIEELYRRSYREKVLGNQRLRWFNASRTVDVVDTGDRKSTRLNSSHVKISYAVCCLKKKIEERYF